MLSATFISSVPRRFFVPCLYGVSLVVVVGEVEELEVERGPQPLHHLRVQPPHGHVAVAEGQ